MKNAIEKAKEGGYDIENAHGTHGVMFQWVDEEGGGKVSNHFLLDPKWWQCLGKAMRWGEEYTCGCTGEDKLWCGGCEDSPSYIQYWHQFIDHIDNGGKANEFFKEILK
jgi:hypothetical protein